MAEVIAMHVACFNATKDHPITKFPKLPISQDQVQRLRRELTAAAMIVSTSLGGGNTATHSYSSVIQTTKHSLEILQMSHQRRTHHVQMTTQA